MTGYSVNLHICIMGGRLDRLSFKEKEGRLVLIYQSAYIYIYTHIFLHIIFLLSTVSYTHILDDLRQREVEKVGNFLE